MGISVWQLAIIVLIVVLLFGTKKLKSLGSDLGESVKGFKKAIKDDDQKDADFKQSLENNAEKSATKEQAKDKEQA
ncbi:Sec-independent protein translocase subunit TatA [Testudinibacter sp. TR-2022]|uniref:Sec-independent protein translocase subunit TatA n=1 Tax=Testudinibacter sp. TR-2022 TaxID=2585029 RepID=UPI00111AB25B|nr:Sec-independent protein translocase subunit TatA [Testudinibacter sp. TR-2022]TNH02063.1 Sec-independent protein translocase subunit TatA [Pasteurellaceae bacterium Phil31]TNH07562.1 Sec-independent protein translocase subunit TatA [Testudinibacter sp. TR-2022]TNH08612.1 Sec-independent protein translocase subunit TatA [Testudinibacter sp. TR-2022]TNH14881.1 Sec-independent protein translocase subunit TatA [Testudinibacter sp. TR-2022]TNH19207.1 Sec-independent protein translocase subunit T